MGSIFQGSWLNTALLHNMSESTLLAMGPLIVRMLSCPGAMEAVLCAEKRPADDLSAKTPLNEAGLPEPPN